MKKMGIVAIVFAVAAGAANYLYARNLENDATGGEKVGVLVTARDFEPGDVIQASDIAIREIPVAYVDDRVVQKARARELVGVPVQLPLKKDQMFQWTDFEVRTIGGKNDLAELVEPGKRAMAIVVNNRTALGGLLKPGHRVDIIGTFANASFEFAGSDDATQRSQVLLQNITVLATGKQMSKDDVDTAFNTVTLSVSVEQGELLSFAGTLGTLSLVLRGYGDMTITEGIPEKGHDDIFKDPISDGPPNIGASSSKIERLQVK